MAHRTTPLPVIPAPREWEPRPGEPLGLDALRAVVPASGDSLAAAEAALAAARLSAVLGRIVPVVTDEGAGDVRLALDPALGPEAYRLTLGDGRAAVAGGDPAGLQHGVTTLVQLAAHGGPLPAGTVADRPRFGWRGLLLDCGRHFMPVDVVKGVVDRLALYKFNVLHWHLTEDQGWRLEIPEYPDLTRVGAWRTERDGTRYGGFYTAADVAEVLAYAAERHVRVVPEIEMPGHAVAALAAYPDLSCTGGPFAVETLWGIHEDVFCAGNDEVFTFLETVLARVASLFPDPFVHVGGDEVPRDRWRACPKCRARIEAEGLADADELQSWFIARVGGILAAHGRRLVGWDEILDGDLAARTDRAVVQAWRGLDRAAAAARAGFDVVVSPTSHAYLDYDPGRLPLSRVFAFDPVPPGLDGAEARRILGGACNLWTESVPPARVDTMLLPRLAAMSEALWTADPDRDFDDFHRRWLGHGPVLGLLGAAAGPEARPLAIDGEFTEGRHRFEVVLDPEAREAFAGHDLSVAGRTAPPGWDPDPVRRPEERGLAPLDAADAADPPTWEREESPGGDRLLQARLFVDGRPYGAPAVLEVASHRALGRTPDLVRAPSRRHPGGGPGGLVDGLRGGRDHEDGRWSGFEGTDLEAVIDLGSVQPVRSVSMRFLQDVHAWILLPAAVEVAWSDDGTTWTGPAPAGHEVPAREQDVVIREFAFDLQGAGARWVRVRAANAGLLPAWHPGRGRPAWLFVDEIVVR